MFWIPAVPPEKLLQRPPARSEEVDLVHGKPALKLELGLGLELEPVDLVHCNSAQTHEWLRTRTSKSNAIARVILSHSKLDSSTF